jgi:hypothetical protein
MCQNNVGTAKTKPAINLSRPGAIFNLPSPPVTRGPQAHLLLLRGKREESKAKGAEIDLDDVRHLGGNSERLSDRLELPYDQVVEIGR